MKPLSYFVALLLGTGCLALSITLVVLARSNQRFDAQLQGNQRALSGSVLGPQAQQISSSVLQDMAASAAANAEMRVLLAKYGYRVDAARTPAAAALEDARKDTADDAPAAPGKPATPDATEGDDAP